MQESLDNKVSRQFTQNDDGSKTEWILLSPENQAKLAALTIGETGDLEVSGTVNAENVKGLGSWINTNRNIVSGLYPLADQTKLSNIEEGAEKNFIRSVNTEQFTVNTEGKLDLAQNYVLTSLYRAEVGNLDDLVRAEGGEGNTTIVDEINYINERLQWQTINE